MKTFIISSMLMVSCSAQPPAAGTVPDASTVAAAAKAVQAETETPAEESTVADPVDAPVAPAKTAPAKTVSAAAKAAPVSTAAFKLTDPTCTNPDLSKVDASQSFMLCNGTMGQGTYTAPVVVAAAPIDPTVIKSGSVVNGVTGTYAPVVTNLTSGNIKSGATVGGVVGTYTGAAQPDLTLLVAGNVKTGITINGVTGTVVSAPANCSANAQVGCVTTSGYKAADFTNLTTGNIKASATVAGVAGSYPSASFPLTGASGTELDSASFQARIKSAAAFSWFDSTGARFTGNGDANIAAGNIVNAVSIFGTAGTLTVAAPNTWDVRYGVTIGSTTGSLKLDCQNSIGSFVTLTNATLCGFSFTDQTPGGGCGASTAANCMYKDNQTGLQISHYLGSKTIPAAKTACANLTLNGLTGWRLPGQEELLSFAAQGIGPSTNASMWNGAAYGQTWSLTVSSVATSNIVVDVRQGQTQPFSNVTDSIQTLCVR
jgi:uncharacterized protein YcfJ